MLKLRTIATQVSGDKVKGFTVPNKISMFFSDEIYFNVEKSGNCIVFSSGANQIVDSKKIEEYNYEDCRIL